MSIRLASELLESGEKPNPDLGNRLVLTMP